MLELLKRQARHIYPFKGLIEARDRLLSERDEARQEAVRIQSELQARLDEEASMPRRALHEKPAFAHWGEDQIAIHYLKDVQNGFYVDIGCYHPSLYSNTKLLHDRGWSGINIDPNPFMIQEFERERPDDVNLRIAIAAEAGSIELMLFHDWASSNTISTEFADAIAKRHDIQVDKRIPTPARPLRDVLDEHASGRTIDFMNIDIESVDIQALESNDWQRYRPRLLAIEDFEFRFDAPRESAIYCYLMDQGYEMVSRCVFTSFFIDQRQPTPLA